MNKKLKEILKYAEQGDIIIREELDEVIIFVVGESKDRRWKLSKKEIEKLMEELDKREIGYELCDGCGACGL